MSGVTSEVSLKYFCVCNVSWGQKEGEEEKTIVYYFPKGTHIDIQVKEVGLCQAIIKFSQTFSSEACDSVYTEKTKRVFFEVEPDFWFIMSVNGGKCVEGLKSVLIQCYESVRMFLGPLQRLASKSPESLRRSLDPLLTKYIVSTIVGKLVTRKPCENFRGLQFLPLDRAPFLQTISILNRIESKHTDIQYSLILQNDSLIWSGLPAEDTQVVFRYLTMSLLPTFLNQEKQSRSPLDPDSSTTTGRFVCGPKGQNDMVNVKRVPRLYLHGCSRQETGFHNMIVYRLYHTTVAWFLTDKADLDMELFRSLEKACREEVAPVVESFKTESDAGCISASGGSSTGDSDIRYVYFNQMNLAVKSQPQQSHVSSLVLELYSHHDSLQYILLLLRVNITMLYTPEDASSSESETSDCKPFVTRISPENQVIYCDTTCGSLCSKLVEKGCSSVESVAKTAKESWVCARSSNSRHFFLSSSERKRYSLDDFNKEVNKICDKQLSTIFFHV